MYSYVVMQNKLTKILGGRTMTYKSSSIKGWWVAKERNWLTFAEINPKETLRDDLFIVGWYENGLATSSNKVVKIIKEGIVTAKGTLYPFEEAHKLYIQYLIKTRDKSTLVATNWSVRKIGKILIDVGKSKAYDYSIIQDEYFEMIADITQAGKTTYDVIFKFQRDLFYTYAVMFSGYSGSSRIILSPFSRRQVCTMIGIPNVIKRDIWFTKDIVIRN